MKRTSIIHPEIISKHINESLSGIRCLSDGRAKDKEKGFYLTEKEYEHLMSVFSDGNVEYLSLVISNAYNKIHKDLFDTKILAAAPSQGWVFKNKNTDLSRWTELYGYGVLMDIVNISGYKDEHNAGVLPVAKTKRKGFNISSVGLQMYSYYNFSAKKTKSTLDGFPADISETEDDIIF